MAKKQIAITTLVGVTAFVAGFLLRTVWNDSPVENTQTGNGAEQTYQSGNTSSSSQGQILSQETASPSGETAEKENTISADSIQVRIDDGEVQWYDGTVWHTVATVEELSREDKFYLALESFRAFSQELQQEKAENPPQFGSDDTFMNGEDLAVGKKETPKPTPKPATPPPAAEETTPQEPPVENNAPAAPSVPSAPSNPTPSTPTPSTPAPSTPAPSDGDGEDIDGGGVDWGSDYL